MTEPLSLRDERIVCPVHGIPDCSPLLNGCDRLALPYGDGLPPYDDEQWDDPPQCGADNPEGIA